MSGSDPVWGGETVGQALVCFCGAVDTAAVRLMSGLYLLRGWGACLSPPVLEFLPDSMLLSTTPHIHPQDGPISAGEPEQEGLEKVSSSSPTLGGIAKAA